MINYLARWLFWRNLERDKPDYSEEVYEEYASAVTCPEQAKSLSPVYAALDLYKSSISTMPIITYLRGANGGRERATRHPAYSVLHDRVNPSLPAATWVEIVLDDFFMAGQHVSIIGWKGNNNFMALYPVPPGNVVKVERDGQWKKTFHIRDDSGVKVYKDEDVIHILKDSTDGITGRGILEFASENLSVHRSVQVSAGAYYRKAVKPSLYVSGSFGNEQATAEAEERFNRKYAGPRKSGRVPFLNKDTAFNQFPNTTAEEAQIIAALGLNVADVARWFRLSPLQLSDLTRGTYSNLGADNVALYQKSFRPVLVKIEQEVNHKVHGANSDYYSEFLPEAALRGSAEQQQVIFNGYVQSGVMTIAEVRERLDLPYQPGTDAPLVPLNMAPATEPVPAQQEVSSEPAPAQNAV